MLPRIQGKVRRAYLVNSLVNTVKRVLVEARSVTVSGIGEYYSLFIPNYGWTSHRIDIVDPYLVFLPGEIDHVEWWWDGWWEQNWKYPDWSWCYGWNYKSEYQAERFRERDMKEFALKRARKQKWIRRNGIRH